MAVCVVYPGSTHSTHTARRRRMVQHKQQQRPGRRALFRPRGRIGSRFLCLLSVCTVLSEAIYVESDPAAKVPEYCTLFHHQVKSAGTTIKDKLESASLEAGLPKPGLCLAGLGYENSCLEALDGSYPVIEAYVELVRDRLKDSGRDCDYFTVMRHPIDRLVSAFFYCPERDPQARPRKWCGQAEQDSEDAAVQTKKSLLEFAQRAWRNKAFEQMTFGMICPGNAFCESAERPPPQNVDAPGALDLLKQVEGILGTYTAVGILEHWDLSMELFNARVKSPVRDWQATPEHLAHLGVHKANPGVSSQLRQEVYRWAQTSPELHAILATDILLYDFAVSVFMRQTAETLGTEWR